MKNANAAKNTSSRFTTRALAQIGVLSAVAFLLMMLEFPLWFAPAFYRLDLSELPVLIGAFAMGPLAGAMIELIKELLYFFLHGSSTAGVGDLANFLFGCCLAVPAGLLYRRKKTKRSALAGMLAGTAAMTLAGALGNAYGLLPLYSAVFHMPMAELIAMGTKINPSITSLSTFVLFVVVPFNLLKGGAVSALTLMLYKHVSPILHGRLS